MSEVTIEEKPALTKKEKTRADKQAEHVTRIKRTLIASILGIFVGVLSYYISISFSKDSGLLAFMLMLACIVIQKHLFILLGMGSTKLGGKDWLYQGFMTFAFWFMTWTILLTSLPPALN
jgi:heme/copper-type cytochrome/quinol oxidase subunit 4